MRQTTKEVLDEIAASRYEDNIREAGDPYFDIREERIRQDQLWGQQSHTPGDWIAILGEEFGEAAKEAVDLNTKLSMLTIERPFAGVFPEIERLRTELVQVAAVAVNIIEDIDRQAGAKE